MLREGIRNISVEGEGTIERILAGEFDISSYLIKYPASTFFMRVGVNPIPSLGINKDDILVVDKRAPISSGKLVVAVIDEQFVIRRVACRDGKIYLHMEKYNDSQIMTTSNEYIWGVVIAAIKST